VSGKATADEALKVLAEIPTFDLAYRSTGIRWRRLMLRTQLPETVVREVLKALRDQDLVYADGGYYSLKSGRRATARTFLGSWFG
jgi:DNA-binding IclR family transcriptional regulator